MNNIKRFIKTSGIYFIGNILSKLIAFILLPLYTVKLSPSDFGTYDLVTTIISFLAPITFFQIWDGMFRFTFDKQKVNEKYYIISNSFFVWILGLVIYSIIFGIIYKILHFDFVLLIFSYGIAIAIQYQYSFIARSFQRNKLFVISGLINSLLSAGVNIVLILKFNVGIESLYIAPIIGCIAQALIIEMELQPFKKIHINEVNIDLQIEMIKFAVPLCIASIAYWLLSGYTKLAIYQKFGTYSNGLFAVANKFSSMITFFITSFQYAWNETAYFIAEDGNRATKYKKSIDYIFKVVMIGSGIFMLLIKLIFPYYINSNYRDALNIIPLALIGVSANAFADFISTIFMAERQTKWIFWTTIFSASINIIGLWIFIPIWGLQGAIGSLGLAFVALALIRTYVVGKILKFTLPKSNIIFFFILSLVICIFYLVNNIILIVIIIIILLGILFFSLRDFFIPLWMSIIKR